MPDGGNNFRLATTKDSWIASSERQVSKSALEHARSTSKSLSFSAYGTAESEHDAALEAKNALAL